MTLRELELFYDLCDTPHVSQLAKKRAMSQSAISLAIRSLERKLEEPLFDRLGKKLVLNERGRLFREKTYRHFQALQDAQNLFKNDKLSGILKIASSKTVGNFIIPSLIYDFIVKHPNITIDKDIKNSAQIIEMVLNGEIDMGIIETESNEPRIAKEELWCDALVVVTSDERLKGKTLYVDQLFTKKWLLREQGSGTRELFLDTLGEMAKSLEIFMEFTEFEEMKTILQRYPETITCISRSAVESELQRGDLYEIALKNIDLRRKLWLIYNKEKYQSNLFCTFHDFIAASAATNYLQPC